MEAIGNPTEVALVVAAAKAGLRRADALDRQPRTAVLPFDSERRYMVTVHRAPTGAGAVYVKGAVEQVLEMSGRELASDGTCAALDAETVLDAADRLAGEGQRVLAFAMRPLVADEELSLDHLGELIFVGLQAMVDPPRPEAVAAVRACRQAGIAVKMITGDHAATAAAIAARVGLTGEDSPRVVTGAELARCPDDQLGALAVGTDVFARVSAEQKLRLVEALQGRGEIVAMTGDGVNDAPALSQADVGVAMGRSGTEVARESADIVLVDDNFASIEAAVEEGRHTFDNLKKFIAWTLPTNAGEGLLILTAIIAGTTLPVLPVQVLWINMTTAVLLGLTLAFERVEPGVMSRLPRRPSEPLLSAEVLLRMLLVSLLLVAVAFWLFEHEIGRGTSVAEARTAAVNVFVTVKIVYLFSCRSLSGRARDLGLLSNRWLLGGVALMIGLQLAFTYWRAMNALFESAPIDGVTWLRVVAVAAVAWTVVEAEKHLRRRRSAASQRTADIRAQAPQRLGLPS